MNIDKSLHDREADRNEGDLLDYAEFIRGQLDYDTVVLTIAESFRMLLVDDDSSPVRSGAFYVAERDLPGDSCRSSRAVELLDPIVAGERGFSFYAGLPLHLSSGANAGTLAALNRVPRPLAADEMARLKIFRDIIIKFLETLSASASANDATSTHHVRP